MNAKNLYDADALSADLKLTNNGYLFAPTKQQLDVAMDNPFVFTVQGGTIYFQRKAIEQIKQRIVSSIPSAKKRFADGPDYEAMIMSRQERLTFGD